MASPPFPESADFACRLAEARAGSLEALGWLWTECRNYLLLVANEKLDPALGAKVSPSDLVQETFLEAQRDLGQFGGQREEELLAWLRRILTNNIANATRRYYGTDMRAVQREVPLLGAEGRSLDYCQDTPTPSKRLAREEMQAALDQALARLPEHYRQVIRLRYDEDLTFAAIGAALGCSAEAARKLWARAVDQLEKELKPTNGT